MKRNDKKRMKTLREGDRRNALKEEGNVHLPPNKVQTPLPKKQRHTPKRTRYFEEDED